MSMKLEELRMIDPVLTSISKGYRNNTFVWDELFPTVSVSKARVKIPVFGKESFIERQTARAPKADSNRIETLSLAQESFDTHEQDLEMAVDHLETEEALYALQYEKQVTKELFDIIALGKEKKAADLAQDHTLYPAGLDINVPLNDAFDDYTSPTDPFDIIRDGMSAVRSNIGRFPNTMIMGEKTARALYSHPKLIERIKYSGKGIITEDILASLFGLQKVRTGLSVHSTDNNTFTDIWGDNIILAYVDLNGKDRSEYSPSFGYTFQREGHPYVDTYSENGGKRKIIRCTDNYSIGIVSRDAAAIIRNTNASS